jgi:SAM-dependent methyltransferase
MDLNYSEETIEAWDYQIGLFARYFLTYARLPRDVPFLLLDLGCGTGTALKIIKTKYPNARLHGCDLEPAHIEICERLNGQYGDFFISDIESISTHWDIIYLSNVLEHLKEWKEKIDHLMSRTNRLYILVPFKEKIASSPLNDDDHSYHINNFDSSTFMYLKTMGFNVDQLVINTPYAWGSSPLRSFLEKYHLDKNKQEYKCELLVCISRKNNSYSKPFYPLIYSIFAKWFLILFPIYYEKYFKKKSSLKGI